jgi:hypothetical protein
MLAAIKEAKSSDELKTIAADHGFALSDDEAMRCYEVLNGDHALVDDDLAGVTGGAVDNEDFFRHLLKSEQDLIRKLLKEESGALSDEELDAVSGGGCCGEPAEYATSCVKGRYGPGKKYVQYIELSYCNGCEFFKTTRIHGYIESIYSCTRP